MTASTSEQLAKLMSGVELLMLDFDGPICSVFAGLPAPVVAERLRRTLKRHGLAIPPTLDREPDPLAVYRHSAAYGSVVTRQVYEELVVAEVEAVASAVPTPGAVDVIRAAAKSGRRVAIVSNNATVAIQGYLAAHQIGGLIHYVAARRTPQPACMKPNPAYLLEAMAATATRPTSAVLVGDSESDVVASRRADVRSIGFANKAGKAERLRSVGADAITDAMPAIAAALRTS
ncbi:HAD family hydrolase [Jiangella endophytica]|uniref:HAD family hydrolase n=1 Tax=Jiangella endophytica TaxID=1623398 RepID=UPI000E351F6A|nr:HAD hydrolase-like protein [Jiangella endophytica]